MRASAPVRIIASAALLTAGVLAAGSADAQSRRTRPAAASPAAQGEPAATGTVAPWGPNAGRTLRSRDGGTIHWNTGNEWGNLGGPGGGGGGGGGG